MAKNTSPYERMEQKWLVDWANMQWFGRFLIKVTNEGKRSSRLGRQMKAEGLRKGASDLFFALPTTEYPGAWIEVKRTKGSHLDPEQKLFLDEMASVGYATKVAKGWLDGKQFIEQYLQGYKK